MRRLAPPEIQESSVVFTVGTVRLGLLDQIWVAAQDLIEDIEVSLSLISLRSTR